MNNVSLFLGVSPDLYACSSGAAFALAAAPFGSLGAEVPALRDALAQVDKEAAAEFSGHLDRYQSNLSGMDLERLRGSQRGMAWILRELSPDRWETVLGELERQDWPLRGGFLATPPQEVAWEGSLHGLLNLLKDPRLAPVLERVVPPLRELASTLMEGAGVFCAGDLAMANLVAQGEAANEEIILETFGGLKVVSTDSHLLSSLYLLFNYTGHLFDALFNRSRMFGMTSPVFLENWIQILRMEAASLIALEKHSEAAETEHALAELSALLAQTIEADGRVPPPVVAQWYVNTAGTFGEAAEYYAFAGDWFAAAKALLNGVAAYSNATRVCIAARLFEDVATCRGRQQKLLEQLPQVSPRLSEGDFSWVAERLVSLELAMVDQDIGMFEEKRETAKANAVRKLKLELLRLRLNRLLQEERWEEAREVDREALRVAKVLFLFELSDDPGRTEEIVRKLEQMSTAFAERLMAGGQGEMALLALMGYITGMEGTLLNEGRGGNEYTKRFLALLRDSVGGMYARAEEILKGLQKWDDVTEAVRRMGAGFFRQNGKPMLPLEAFLKYYSTIIGFLEAQGGEEASLAERLQWHRGWLSKVGMEEGEFMNQVAGARPRVEGRHIVFYSRAGKALPGKIPIPPGKEVEIRRRFAATEGWGGGQKPS